MGESNKEPSRQKRARYHTRLRRGDVNRMQRGRLSRHGVTCCREVRSGRDIGFSDLHTRV